MIRALSYRLVAFLIRLKWYILGDYYARLIVQARYLYRQSPLFRYRRQEVDLEFAEKSFDDNAEYFLSKVKKEHWIIRVRILWDFISGNPSTPYAMRGNDIL